MSTSATDPTTTSTVPNPQDASTVDKGKNKAPEDVKMDKDNEEDEEDSSDEDDSGEEEEEDDEEQEDDSMAEIDTGAIINSGRRTRGVKVDYTSKEALEKAGLDTADDKDEDDDDDAMKA